MKLGVVMDPIETINFKSEARATALLKKTRLPVLGVNGMALINFG